MVVAGEYIGLAFGLNAAAAACTTIGALITVFVKFDATRVLSVSLAFAAGAMLYVSMVDIFMTKAIAGFQDSGQPQNKAYIYATLCFFGGCILIGLLELVTHSLTECASRHGAFKSKKPLGSVEEESQQVIVKVVESSALTGNGEQFDENAPLRANDAAAIQSGETCIKDSAGSWDGSAIADKDVQTDPVCTAHVDHDRDVLLQLSVLTGLAISLHNLPEGLATFVSTLANPAAGVLMCIAIALHNIPEGIAMALPIFYATGSRTKAVLWASLSGVSEVLGGLLAYLVLADASIDLAYGIIFGIVSGMMVTLSISELLPKALEYDTTKKVTMPAFFTGMTIMAASLMLFAA